MTQPKEKVPITDTPLFWLIVGIIAAFFLIFVFTAGVLFERASWNKDCSAMGMRNTDKVYACFADTSKK